MLHPQTYRSLEHDTSLQTSSLTPNETCTDAFFQRIEEEYNALCKHESDKKFYLETRSGIFRAIEDLRTAPDGTFFVRPAFDNERKRNVEYILTFVSHKKIANIGICCDKEHRRFWLLSGHGPGSEVKLEYTGIDVLICRKRKNRFLELQYPFRINLNQSIDTSSNDCSPLPDKVRVLDHQDTILHELARAGSTEDFKKLIQISADDNHPFRKSCLFIIHKINGRDRLGRTPLMIAIQSSHYEFVELLLDKKAEVNLLDTHGCSAFHYACRRGNWRILEKLIDRAADPYYINTRESSNDDCLSNIFPAHYLAMANQVTAEHIEKCATLLFKYGCPLMPLTYDEKTPFDISKMYNNDAYDCIKIFLMKHKYFKLNPISVTTKNEARKLLKSLTSPSLFQKIRTRFKSNINPDSYEHNGLFVIYRTPNMTKDSNEQYGLYVHHNERIFEYTIIKTHQYKFADETIDPPRDIIYEYSLKYQSNYIDSSIAIYRQIEELIYNYTKYKGILPTTLQNYVHLDDNDEIIIKNAKSLLKLDNHLSNRSPIPSPPRLTTPPITPDTIQKLLLQEINSITLINKNTRHIIRKADVHYDNTQVFSYIIKDYLPIEDIEENINNTTHEFILQSKPEFNRESKLLLHDLKDHPFIVQAFVSPQQLNQTYRLFMEFIPNGDLHTYLTQLNKDICRSLSNAFYWIYQIAQVFEFLSRKKIVHRCLTARNILLVNEQYIKICDFSLSCNEGTMRSEDLTGLPLRCTAPELLSKDQKFFSSADVWSFAILLWEIYSFGSLPYGEYNNDNNTEEIIHFLKDFLISKGRYLLKPKICSQRIYDLMCCCWNRNPDRRPSFTNIIEELNTSDEIQLWAKAKEFYQSKLISSQTDEYIEVIDTDTNTIEQS